MNKNQMNKIEFNYLKRLDFDRLRCIMYQFYFQFQIQFVLLFSRQGKLRLQKWFESIPEKNKKKISRELITSILSRKPKMSSFLEWKDYKIIYKRYYIPQIQTRVQLIHIYFLNDNKCQLKLSGFANVSGMRVCISAVELINLIMSL